MVTIGIAVIKLLNILSFIILIKCFMTWIPGGTQNRVYEIFCVLTDPIEEPIRSVMHKFINGPIDFSPVVALLLIRMAQRAIGIIMF